MNKKIAIAAFMAMSMVSCNSISVNSRTEEGIDIVIIDDCQYLKSATYGLFYVYSHKGNCNNPIHRNEKDSNRSSTFEHQ